MDSKSFAYSGEMVEVYHMRFRFISLSILFLVSFPFSGCIKKNSVQSFSNYFMSAEVNGKLWKTTEPGKAYFLAYRGGRPRWELLIGGSQIYTDTVANQITISFEFAPKPGRYFFNNQLYITLDSGISAQYSYYRQYSPSNKWSTGGFVDIESISKDEITGSFNFTAKGDITDSTTSFIKNGKFDVLYEGGDSEWTGP